MNLADVLRGLWRRWYIVVPGLLLAVAVAFGAWFTVQPGYERTASQLLLPGAQSVPDDANPFLYLGGLSNAADVIVRAVGSENVMADVALRYPDAEVEVTRDTSTSGPVILIRVTGSSDAEASAVVDLLVAKTAEVLADLQDGEQIAADDRISVVPISIDDQSVLQQRSRIVVAAALGIATAVLAVVAAALIDGLILQRRRRARPGGEKDDLATESEDAPTVADGVVDESESFDPLDARGEPAREWIESPHPPRRRR